MTSWVGVALAGLFIVLNGFFVAAEFALVKVRDTQLAPLAKKGHRGATITRGVISRLDRFLNASQLGITLSSLALGWIGEPALAAQLTPLFAFVGIGSDRVVHTVAFALSFIVLSMAHILFGELVPKFIGLRRTVPTALFAARPLLAFRFLFYPFLAIMDMLSEVVLRALGMPPQKHAEGALSEEEIRLMLESEHAREQLPERKRALLMRVLRSADRAVRLSMVPRVDMIYLNLEDPIEVCVEKSRTHEFSRFPVVREQDLDQVAGYVHVRDLVYGDKGPVTALQPILREPLFVPETATVADLLDKMRSAHVHIGIVVDEYGGTSGMLTLEDLLEEIVGEIQDEFDTEPATMVRLEDGTIRMQGSVALADAVAYLGLDAPADHEGTLGGYVIDRLGRIPKRGDRVDLDGTTLEVAAVRRRRIAQVVVRASERPSGDMRHPLPSLDNEDRPSGSGDAPLTG
jgi:CBS domain containing-hemolysin-like protein